MEADEGAAVVRQRPGREKMAGRQPATSESESPACGAGWRPGLGKSGSDDSSFAGREGLSTSRAVRKLLWRGEGRGPFLGKTVFGAWLSQESRHGCRRASHVLPKSTMEIINSAAALVVKQRLSKKTTAEKPVPEPQRSSNLTTKGYIKPYKVDMPKSDPNRKLHHFETSMVSEPSPEPKELTMPPLHHYLPGQLGRSLAVIGKIKRLVDSHCELASSQPDEQDELLKLRNKLDELLMPKRKRLHEEVLALEKDNDTLDLESSTPVGLMFSSCLDLNLDFIGTTDKDIMCEMKLAENEGLDDRLCHSLLPKEKPMAIMNTCSDLIPISNPQSDSIMVNTGSGNCSEVCMIQTDIVDGVQLESELEALKELKMLTPISPLLATEKRTDNFGSELSKIPPTVRAWTLDEIQGHRPLLRDSQKNKI
ncbi:hypothetical protein lerEdw1_001405 [Lerista edwardsae]|nr:hypothetical protein lerEdw1_001405 [Lerista edwardsae]